MTNTDENINDDDSNEEDDQLEGNVQIARKDMKALRAQAKKATAAETKLASLEREMAFSRAKIDTEDPKMSYFIKGYEGDLTSDAIRAEAEKAGFLIPAGTGNGTGNAGSSGADRGSIERITDASRGGGTNVDNTNLEEAIRNAKDPNEVMALMTKAGYPTPLNRPSD